MMPTATEQPAGRPGMLHTVPRFVSVTARMTKYMCREIMTSIARPRNGPSSCAGWKGVNMLRWDSGVKLK